MLKWPSKSPRKINNFITPAYFFQDTFAMLGTKNSAADFKDISCRPFVLLIIGYEKISGSGSSIIKTIVGQNEGKSQKRSFLTSCF
jgi:hypothetical protein